MTKNFFSTCIYFQKKTQQCDMCESLPAGYVSNKKKEKKKKERKERAIRQDKLKELHNITLEEEGQLKKVESILKTTTSSPRLNAKPVRWKSLSSRASS